MTTLSVFPSWCQEDGCHSHPKPCALIHAGPCGYCQSPSHATRGLQHGRQPWCTTCGELPWGYLSVFNNHPFVWDLFHLSPFAWVNRPVWVTWNLWGGLDWQTWLLDMLMRFLSIIRTFNINEVLWRVTVTCLCMEFCQVTIFMPSSWFWIYCAHVCAILWSVWDVLVYCQGSLFTISWCGRCPILHKFWIMNIDQLGVLSQSRLMLSSMSEEVNGIQSAKCQPVY